MENKLYMEMDDSENRIKEPRHLTEDDNMLLLQVAKKYHYIFEEGSELDRFSKSILSQNIARE